MTRAAAYRHYAWHGVRLRSRIDLGPGDAATDAWDLTIQWAAAPINAPEGARLLASLRVGDALWYAHHADGAGAVLSYTGICTMRLDRERRTLAVWPEPGGRADMVPLMVAGNALALALLLDGACVLHAGAVAAGERAIAFAGGSGIGKSTLVALCCGAGARPLSDDLLHVALEGDEPRCHTGPPVVRLRSGARSLAAGLEAKTAATPDERVALEFPAQPSAPFPLAAIVLPRPHRTITHTTVHRLPPREALLALMACPRVVGVQAPELLRSTFTACARLAREVPVYRAEIPWGPPFDPSVADVLLSLGERAPAEQPHS